MKRLALCILALCFVALPTMGSATNTGTIQGTVTGQANTKFVVRPGGTVECVTANDKPCTQAQVKALAAAYSDESTVTRRQDLAARLSLAKDGTTLLCGTAPCTTAHLPALNAAAKKTPSHNSPAGSHNSPAN